MDEGLNLINNAHIREELSNSLENIIEGVDMLQEGLEELQDLLVRIDIGEHIVAVAKTNVSETGIKAPILPTEGKQ